MKLHRLLLQAFATVCWLIVPPSALAQNPEQALLADFPPLSIDSVERAEEAIARLPEVRDQLNRRYESERANCLERFFVASCLSDLRTRERKAYKAINRIDVEAKALLRRERAAERDRAVAERERRAAESGGKAIPFSGATRNKDRSEQESGDGRASSKPRLQIERVPEPGVPAEAESAPASDVDAVPDPADAETQATRDGAAMPDGETPAIQEASPDLPAATGSGHAEPVESGTAPDSRQDAVPDQSGSEPPASAQSSPELPATADPTDAVMPAAPAAPEAPSVNGAEPDSADQRGPASDSAPEPARP